MRIAKVVLSVIYFYSPFLAAQDTKNYTDTRSLMKALSHNSCPSFHSDFTSVLDKLSEIKKKVKSNPECQDLSGAIENLHAFLKPENRQVIQDIIKDAKQTNAEVEWSKLDKISEFTQTASTQVLNVIELFSNNRACVEKANAGGFLNGVATVAKQFSGIAASLQGPYSVPVAVAGNVFAGIVKGINTYLTKDKYDFRQKEQRELFRTNLCIYSDIRQEVIRLTRPESRQKSMEEFESKVLEKIERVSSGCGECAQIILASNTRDAFYSKLEKANLELTSLSKAADSSVTTCLKTSAYIRDQNSFARQSIKEFRSYLTTRNNNESTQVYNLATFDKIMKVIDDPANIPDSASCFPDGSKTSNSVIDTIKIALDFVSGFYNEEIQTLARRADDKYAQTMGKYTLNAIDTYNWVTAEIERIKDRNGVGSFNARFEIEALKVDLDKSILQLMGPQYIKWHIEQARHYLKKAQTLQLDLEDWVVKSLRVQKINANNLTEGLSIIRFRPENITLGEADDAFLPGIHMEFGKKSPQVFQPELIYSEAENVIGNYFMTFVAVGTVGDYCMFFRKAGLMMHETANVCQSREIEKLGEQIISLSRDPKSKSLFDFVEWARDSSDLKVKDWADLMETKITSWLETPDSILFSTKDQNEIK